MHFSCTKVTLRKLDPPLTCFEQAAAFWKMYRSGHLFAYALAQPPYFLTNGHHCYNGALESALDCVNTAVNQAQLSFNT